MLERLVEGRAQGANINPASTHKVENPKQGTQQHLQASTVMGPYLSTSTHVNVHDTSIHTPYTFIACEYLKLFENLILKHTVPLNYA